MRGAGIVRQGLIPPLPIHIGCLFLRLTAFACNGSVANIVTIEAAIPFDSFGQCIGLLLCHFNGVAHCRCTQYATTCGHNFASGIQCGARVEHFTLQVCSGVQSVDDSAFSVVAG